MAKYRKRPIVIDAVQWTGDNRSEVLSFGRSGPCPLWGDDFKFQGSKANVLIRTLEGTMTGRLGDWIIRGVNGEFYPCKPDIFSMTYEEVEG